MNFNEILRNTAAVVRTKNNKHIVKRVNQLLEIGISKVIVICDALPDEGSTRAWMRNLLLDPRVILHEMFKGHSWSNALNLSLQVIQMAGIEREHQRMSGFEYVFNVSVEAGFTREHLEKMLSEFSDPLIGVVGTSFKGLKNGNEYSLGRSYKHPRNTGMLIRLQAFYSLFGGFDAWCDQIGGMEDIDFILRMRARSELKEVMLDLKVPLIVGEHYDQDDKEKRERAAMDKIINRWHSLFYQGTIGGDRIDQAIAEMGIEED